ncbi:MAG: GDP-mannose 4,6-dehydratase [Nitrospirota bacterium]|nr:GDP-mannose 4,6-dehydratase [Nitrospirota bacterium]
MDRILVTGGAGFIGSSLVDQLLAQGRKVVCVDNFNDFYDPAIKRGNIVAHLANPNYTLHEGDICDLPFLEKLFDGEPFTHIVHLAARAGVRPSVLQPLLYEEVNVRGTLNLLELSKRHGMKNFIFGSTSSIYGDNEKVPFSEDDRVDFPVSPYAATKKAAELLCYNYHHLYGMNVTCLRFFTVYGPRQRPEMAIHKFTHLIDTGGEIPLYGDGSALRDFTYVDDILQGVVAAIDRCYPFEIINLGESETTDMKRLIRLIEEAVGKKARINYLPSQPGDVKKTYADISKARRLLDYNPHTKVEKGVPLFVEWYRKVVGQSVG